MEAARDGHATGVHVTCLWFPEPRGDLFDLGNGVNARVQIGSPAYQLCTGEIVEVL